MNFTYSISPSKIEGQPFSDRLQQKDQDDEDEIGKKYFRIF